MSMKPHRWSHFRAGGVRQVALQSGEDIASLSQLDPKEWSVLSMPVNGTGFDRRMLELMDADHDGRIRIPEVIGAVNFLAAHSVDLQALFSSDPNDTKRLDDLLARRRDCERQPLTKEESKALSDWETAGKSPAVLVLGVDTAEAESAFSKVERVIEEFFKLPEDLPLVTDTPDVVLPLTEHLNPRYQMAMADFVLSCVKPILGVCSTLNRSGWERIKASFVAYRQWRAAKPEPHAHLLERLDDEERTLRYRMHLLEFLENFVNMRRLYAKGEKAIFQVGTLRMDSREMSLCFEVADENSHAALSGRSSCCMLYLALSRPAFGLKRNICVAVTAGTVGGLYVGRNGVFFDRDGADWEATVTRVVEAQVSLREAFWSPWKKIAAAIGATIGKTLGAKQSATVAALGSGAVSAASKSSAEQSSGGGAAMASSVAAIGIGLGMLGAAAASIFAAIKGMSPLRLSVSVLALVAVVSLPGVFVTWFKLRRRDIGAILNASGWAVNRPLGISMRMARSFTRRH